MSDQLISLIRTYVPIGVGIILTWLASTAGIILDPSSSAAVTAGVTGLVIAVYYGIARLLEKVSPVFGVLLGATKQPVYPPAPVDTDRPID